MKYGSNQNDAAHALPTESEIRDAELDLGCAPDPQNHTHCVYCGWDRNGGAYCPAKDDDGNILAAYQEQA